MIKLLRMSVHKLTQKARVSAGSSRGDGDGQSTLCQLTLGSRVTGKGRSNGSAAPPHEYTVVPAGVSWACPHIMSRRDAETREHTRC